MFLSSFAEDVIVAELHTLCEHHLWISSLREQDSRRVIHYKRFARNLVERLQIHSDGSLFSVVRVASTYPSDVVAMVCQKKQWANTLQERAMLSDAVMKRWPVVLRRTRMPAERRTYTGRNEDVLRYYKHYVRELVDELGSSRYDGGLRSLLEVVLVYPVDVQEMACTRFRSSVMRYARIDQAVMEQWTHLVRLDRLAWLDPKSVEHTRCTAVGAKLLMDLLAENEDVGDFPNVVRLFPSDAVYSALVVQRVQFRERFHFIADDPVMWNRIVSGWARNAKPEYEFLHAQVGLVVYFRWALTAYRRTVVASDGQLTVKEFLELHPEEEGSSGGPVNFSALLFDERYRTACESTREEHTLSVKYAHRVSRALFKRTIVQRVVRLVVAFENVAIALLGDDVVSKVRAVLVKRAPAAVGPARPKIRMAKLIARFLRLTSNVDARRALTDMRMMQGQAEIGAYLAGGA